ncbi:MAG: extracellular solute-binding protein [Anaerolineae bacterium]|nr:extracellular solute-binding protein [Anaerolineae bacterium]
MKARACSTVLAALLLMATVFTMPVVAQEAPVEIDVYTVAWSAPSQEMMAQLIEMFNEAYAGQIHANYVQGDWGEGDTYIAAGVAGGGGIACLIEWWTGGGQEWYKQGFSADMAPYMDEEDWATMPDELWASRMAEDGKVFFSGTVEAGPSLIYYNPALFEAAGLEAPTLEEGAWTWEEFLEAARALTVDANGNNLRDNPDEFDAGNVVQWGFIPRYDTEKVWEEAAAFAMQASGKPVIRQLEDSTWDAVLDEEALTPIEIFLGMIREGVAPELALGLTGDSQDEAFAQGMTAMVLRGYFNIGVLGSRYPDFEFAVMPTPMQPGSKLFIDNINGQGFAIPITCEHPAEAVEFAMWFQQPEPQALWASSLYISPVNPEALADPMLAEDPDWDAMRYYESIWEVLVTPYNENQAEFIETLWVPTMMRYVQGEIPFEEAVETVRAGAADILNQ